NSIGTVEAGAVILINTPGKKDLQQLTVIKTLGQLKYQPAEPYLIGLVAKANDQLRKQILAALANIGGKESYKTFATAAKSVKFQPDVAETMIACLQYAKRLAEQGETKLSNKLCASVMKKCIEDNQLIYRSSALAVPGFGNNELFLKEIQHQNKVYRNAVLTNAAAGLNSGNIGSWIAAMKTAPAETQAEILHFLVNRAESEVLQNAIMPGLSSGEETVRLEAIRTLAVNQKQKAVPILIEQLKIANSDNEQAEIELALLNTCSVKECGLLIAQLDGMNDAGKKVLIKVLGERRATDAFAQIINYCNSGNASLRTVAFAALEKVSKTENAPELIALLKNTDDKESVKNIQNALIAIYSGTTKPDANLVLKEIETGGMSDKLIPVLSSLNDPKALKKVVGLLKTGTQAEQEA
ncbi:MAG: hypothetical protein Q8K69_06225, partial [Bacteroidota bacterium]|nr:hypothetical protein [Bacteroidota bacterium]